ncbi:MAG TPA: cytochrome c [Sphingomicrobium sp.]
MRARTVQWIIGGAFACALLGALGAVAYVKSGLFNVAATKRHSTLTWWATHETMIHSVRHYAAGISAPAQFTPQQVLTGFCAYQTHCVACHGAAGVPREQWASGFEPSPPYLLDVTNIWNRAQLFWLVKNGIKMTGMPAWGESMSDPEIWDVVAFIEASRQLPPQTYVQWAAQKRCSGPVEPPTPTPPRLPPSGI